jgi:hypothetical protein
MFRFKQSDGLLFAVCLLIAVNYFPTLFVWRQAATSDFAGFVAGGRHAGTALLLHPANYFGVFLYTPGSAWMWRPFAGLSATAAYVANVALMIACAAIAVPIAARLYRVSTPTAAALIFAWAPTANAAVVGQTSPFGMLLALLTIDGLARRSVLLTALPLVLLFYKPTFALPLFGLLLLRSRWREVAIVSAGLCGWYLLSVAAAAGDWAVLQTWAHAIRLWSPLDYAKNRDQENGLPSLLRRFAVAPALIADAVGVAFAAIFIPLLRRIPLLEAASCVCLLGIAVSPHALGYDAVFALPTIFVLFTVLRDRRQLWILAVAYAIAMLGSYTAFIHVDPIAFLVLAAAVWWFARYRVGPPAGALSPSS